MPDVQLEDLPARSEKCRTEAEHLGLISANLVQSEA